MREAIMGWDAAGHQDAAGQKTAFQKTAQGAPNHPPDGGGGAAARRPFFTRFSQGVADYAGKPATFIGAAGIIVLWALTGPVFGFNDTWQLIINTSTTIVTFLMVFLIQNSQNRDTAALQIKLDELIARLDGPRNALLDLEELDEKALARLRADYGQLAEKARGEANAGAAPDRSGDAVVEICAPPDHPAARGVR